MYNLFVSASEVAWDGPPFDLEADRCLTEYTVRELSLKYRSLDESALTYLRRLPCIFAYESSCKRNPHFGRLVGIQRRQEDVRISYSTQSLSPILTHEVLLARSLELDIDKLELYRTHWALKDVDLDQELAKLGVILPAWASSSTGVHVNLDSHQFRVGLSFPGEARDTVRAVALALRRIEGNGSYFYDADHRGQLARPNLDVYLQALYRHRCTLLVVFIGSDYQTKKWCGIEWKSIRNIITNREEHRVMLIRIDDGDVDGINSSDGYVDAREHSPDEIAQFISDRLVYIES